MTASFDASGSVKQCVNQFLSNRGFKAYAVSYESRSEDATRRVLDSSVVENFLRLSFHMN